MARIDIRSNGGAALNDGVLQLENGVAMDTTLRNVADQNNTTSPLLLSTTAVQVVSPLRITTDDPSDMYLDCEDGSTNNRFNITRNTASQQVNLNFASNPAGSTTTVGAIRTFTDGVNLGEVVKFREDGQVTFTERVNVEADSLVTTQGSSVIAASTTNANLVIAPNGTGALVASIPDGTATGGNARGTNSVDLQTNIAAATNVASGNYSTILGGQSNTASSVYGVVSGGQLNTASTGINATVVGGKSNTASGNYSLSGGQNATASGTRSIAFGESAVATGTNSVCLGGGSAQGAASTALAGSGNNALSTYSLAQGYVTETTLYGQVAFSGTAFVTDFSERGFCQQSTLVANRAATLTTGGTTVLSLDGTGVTNLIIPNGNNRVWNVVASWAAVVTTITGTATGVSVGDVATECNLFAFKRISGVSSIVGTVTNVASHNDASMATAAMGYTAGASQELIPTFTAPTFVGGGSLTIRVVVKLMLTEVAY
jgi:hypothetical protein